MLVSVLRKKFGPAMDVQLAVEIFGMKVHGIVAHSQAGRNLLGGHVRQQHCEYLRLARGKALRIFIFHLLALHC